jgi:hypothetical protein
MFKTPLAKWALAAMLAVPAVPMFAKTTRLTTHHRLAVHKTSHTPLISMSAPHKQKLSRKTTRHTTYSTRRRATAHRTASARHLTHRTNVRHTSLKTTSKFKVHVTKMPPTIDGINA